MNDPLRRAIRDPHRLSALRERPLQEAHTDQALRRMTRLVSRALSVPTSLIVLVDGDRQYFESHVDLPESFRSLLQTPATRTFCQHVALTGHPIVMEDVREHPTFQGNPTIRELNVVAYLGIPLTTTDTEIGTLCAVDHEPHSWTNEEVDTMRELAAAVMSEIRLRLLTAEMMQSDGEEAVRSRAERRREQLERRQKSFEQAMKRRGRLIRGFTHDLKNPLGAADGQLQLLEMGLRGELTPRQQEGISRARATVRDALGLLDDLVQLTQAEAGRMSIEREEVDLRTVLRELTEDYRAPAETKSVRLELEIEDEMPAIESDRSRLRQILGNLLSNAVKYTDEGRILVRAGVLPADAGGEREVAIAVSDTGPGIAPEQRSRLFREFSRLENGKSGKSGTGLGLAISQRVARALGGRITVESEVGAGSTFILRLPLEQAAS